MQNAEQVLCSLSSTLYAPMVTPSYSVTCTKKNLIAPGVYEFAFPKPEGFTFKAGQFVLFDVPLLANPSDIQPRAYSIASAPSDAELLFVIKLLPGGRMSTYVEKELQVGTTMTFKGPFGLFTLKEDDSANMMLACTGAGIAPFRSMVMEALAKGDARSIDLLFVVRNEEDFFWLDCFRDLAAKHPQFTLHLSLTQPKAGWQGLTGRVQQAIPQVSKVVQKNMSDILLYACGNPDMTKDVKALAIGPWGMPKERVHIEGYI